MTKEIIPSPHTGDPYNTDLAELDIYVAKHIGITPTKYSSELYANSPPVDHALKMQKLMTKEHLQLYGDFFKKTIIPEYSLNQIDEIIGQYTIDIEKVPIEYGAVEGAALDSYFKVGVDRSYRKIKTTILEEYGIESPANYYILILEEYAKRFNIPAWQAARFTTRVIDSAIQLCSDSSSVTLKDALQNLLYSDIFISHLNYMQEQTKSGRDIDRVFNASLRSMPKKSSKVEIILNQKEMDGLTAARNIMERPYTQLELDTAQRFLDSDHDLKNSIVVFHTELLKYISAYFSSHPERLAHTLEFFTEMFLSAKDESGNISFIPNPKLLSVISKNVLPAVARVFIESGSNELTSEHLTQGAQVAKDLKLFQTMIGEYNRKNVDGEEIEFGGFFNQTCPAMKPFSNALVEVLPRIYYNLIKLRRKDIDEL